MNTQRVERNRGGERDREEEAKRKESKRHTGRVRCCLRNAVSAKVFHIHISFNYPDSCSPATATLETNRMLEKTTL